MTNWFRKRWKRITVALLAATILTEIALRAFWGFGNPPLLQQDPEIGYLFRARQELRRLGNRVKINSYHQRSEEVTPEPPSGVLRMLCVGDSVTWGGVLTDQKDTYPELLAAMLKAKGTPTEVLNASAGGWGIGNEVAYLERFGLMGSRILVLQIGSHDFVQPKNGHESVGTHPSMPDRKPLSAITEVLGRYLWPVFIGAEPGLGDPTDAEKKDLFARNMQELCCAFELARAAKARVIVLHTPNRNEVAPTNGQRDKSYEQYRKVFLALCAEQGVTVVNLTEEWQDCAGVGNYFRDGVHPNPSGNKAIAERLASVIGKP
jgi:lysophospholipase L1-like esterase